MATDVKTSNYPQTLFRGFDETIKPLADIAQTLLCNTTTTINLKTGDDYSECGPWETNYACWYIDIPEIDDPIGRSGRLSSGDPGIQLDEDNTFAVQIRTECPSVLQTLWPFGSVSSHVSHVSADLITSQGSFPLFHNMSYGIDNGDEQLTLSVARGRFDMESANRTCIADDWTLTISRPDEPVWIGATIYNGSFPIMGHNGHDQCEDAGE